jgi:Raf kinase inhibitor-like YbhB/YbcL family protein
MVPTGRLASAALILSLAAGCGGEAPGTSGTISLRSPGFTPTTRIPDRHAKTGGNVSPALTWTDAPAGTKEFAVLVDDPDAPGGTFTHWVAYGIPAHAKGLPEGIPSGAEKPPALDGGVQGKNSWGEIGWGGPDPPAGPAHKYSFQVYALKEPIPLGPGATGAQLVEALKGRTLGSGRFLATYGR